jgi:hypothetical protein
MKLKHNKSLVRAADQDHRRTAQAFGITTIGRLVRVAKGWET